MTPPEGTFLAPVRSGVVQLPPLVADYCEMAEWNLFRVVPVNHNLLELEPILPSDIGDMEDVFQSSLSPDGKLWIPAELRESVALGDQSVMVRIENGVLHIFLREVFKTLGFGP